MYQQTTLENGLRVVTGEMPHTRSATVSVYVGAGSRYEPDEEAGLSHFLEHMLFKGASRRPTAKDISEAIESVGGVHNAATDRFNPSGLYTRFSRRRSSISELMKYFFASREEKASSPSN